MFTDISGFTNLTEHLSKQGPLGAEKMAFAINSYMEKLVTFISRSGGDIFKFAGGILFLMQDAMIIVWPPPANEEEMQIICLKAVKNAIQI